MSLVAVMREEIELPHNTAWDEVELEVGVSDSCSSPYEATSIKVIRRGQARSLEEPLDARESLEMWVSPRRYRIETNRLRAKILDVEFQMVL